MAKTLQEYNLGLDKSKTGAKAGFGTFSYTYNNLKTILPYLADKDFKYSLKLRSTELVSMTEVQTKTKNGVKQEWQVVLNTKWVMKFNDEPEEILEVIGIGTQTDADKANGTAQTYARRYALIGYFNLNDGGEYDPEQKEEVKPKPTVKPTVKKVEETKFEDLEFVEPVKQAEPKVEDKVEEEDEFDSLFG